MTTSSSTHRTALTGVRVFDGTRLSPPRTVIIDGAVIGTETGDAADTVDADGAVLLPGLIDAHIHLHGRDTLEQLAAWGVTTALDMATWPADLVRSLRNAHGLTDIRSAGLPVIGPAGPHSHFGMPEEAVLADPEQAARFVANRIAEGADYIKIVLEAPGQGGPDPAVAAAVIAAAHDQGRQVVAHASSHGAYESAVELGADVITHIPAGEPVAENLVARMVADHRVAVPTLTVMRALATMRGTADAFAGASAGVAALHAAGVPILAGTDAAEQPGLPRLVAHGESLHSELELLVEAGLSTVDALRAATVLPARHFGMPDRGVVEPGKRADLVLVDGDPLADITATRNIRRIWCAGTEYTPAVASRAAEKGRP
ncbi:putative amidohydrolase [Nocardia nova SH22a]|uniref:Putative amidohydrolase n=1 Tax=Nocardia nova SH22a TaxID=1415166 RepID=W5TH81_9NOCA|nr:amidohydrolase family protein [Nocardia nova]AHH18562.1 putative amidohydrolase [Nocardia nova SH22a]